MRVGVNVDQCVGCELCKEVCSEVFGTRNDVATVLQQPRTAQEESACLEARSMCPVVAITTKY